MTKALSYDAMLALEEAQIRRLFPHGATEEKSGWVPASESTATLSLDRLLKAKEDRQEPPRFMARGGPPALRWSTTEHRYVDRHFTSNEEHGYTQSPSKALEPVEVPPPEVVEGYGKDAEARRNAHRAADLVEMQAKVIAVKLAKLQREGARFGVDLAPKLQALIKDVQMEISRSRAA
jgi:hypothetical protein